MRILITGIGGMLGHDLARVLKDSHQIFGVGRKKRSFGNGIKYFRCDLLNPSDLQKIVKQVRPDVVIHSAGKTQVDDCELNPLEAYSENVLATQFLVKALKPYRPRFIHVSSDYVFDGKKKSPYVESDSPAPLSAYGATKFLGEEAVRNSGLSWVIVRTSWLYGLNGPNFVETMLRMGRDRDVLNVVTDQKGSPTYTKDLAFAIKKIVEEKKSRGIFNVTNSGVTNWNAYAKAILKESGLNHIKVLGIKARDFNRPAPRPENSVLDNSKFQKTFRFKARNWQAALKDYLKEAQAK